MFLVLLAGFLLPSSATALTITNCDGEQPLKEAVASGGSYDFDCPAGSHTIYLSAPIDVGTSVSLDATGDQIRIVTTNQNEPLFKVHSGTLELVNFFLQNSRGIGSPVHGADGTNGVEGEAGENLPCMPENEGERAGDAADATSPLNNATNGADGGDADGGAIWIGDGASVNLYGGTVMGSVGGQAGGSGGRGGDGARGGAGGEPNDWFNCFVGIYGGNGGNGSSGAPGADGGDGGDGRGGGVFVSAGGTLNVRDTTFDRSVAAGGRGGGGGDGGVGGWGGLVGHGSALPFNGSRGERGGNGARGGEGGDGGVGRGGAIYNEGTVNLTKTHFIGVAATNGGGGIGGRGGEAGNLYGIDDSTSGQGGDGGDGGDAGISEGGAIYSAVGASLNVYSAEFIKNRAGAGTDPGIGTAVIVGGGAGGPGGRSGGWADDYTSPTGGDGGDGGNGGSASWASVAGPIAFKGCAAFTNSWVPVGLAGDGGIRGEFWSVLSSPGVAGIAGAPGIVGQLDPEGFAPYPCDLEPFEEGPPGSDVCKDGVDNDNDGFIDAEDPGCQDKSAPRASLSGALSQKLGKSVLVKVRCIDEACTANASGSISIGSRGKPSSAGVSARKLRLGGARKKLGKGKTVAFRLKISPKARKAAGRALKKKRGVTARIKVTVSDGAGNRRNLSRVVKLKRR